MNIMSTREEMGFTHRELAGYLGIQRTQLTMAERGYRSLPFKALLKFSRMKRCLTNTAALEQMAAAIKVAQQEKLPELLAEQETLYRMNILMLEQKLQRLREEYSSCINTLAQVALLRQIPGTEGDAAATTWLNSLEAKMNNRSWYCGPMAQTAVLLRLLPLQYMLEQLQTNNHVFFNH
jgi:transcriptional regulator with XRE-family HTH domain